MIGQHDLSNVYNPILKPHKVLNWWKATVRHLMKWAKVHEKLYEVWNIFDCDKMNDLISSNVILSFKKQNKKPYLFLFLMRNKTLFFTGLRGQFFSGITDLLAGLNILSNFCLKRKVKGGPLFGESQRFALLRWVKTCSCVLLNCVPSPTSLLMNVPLYRHPNHVMTYYVQQCVPFHV